MPPRARLDEFIAAVESGDHAGAIEGLMTTADISSGVEAFHVATCQWLRSWPGLPRPSTS